MVNCAFMKLCPLFQLEESGISHRDIESYKRKYCRADRFACARYLVATAVGQDKVPADLVPNESDRALKIMRAGG